MNGAGRTKNCGGKSFYYFSQICNNECYSFKLNRFEGNVPKSLNNFVFKFDQHLKLGILSLNLEFMSNKNQNQKEIFFPTIKVDSSYKTLSQ